MFKKIKIAVLSTYPPTKCGIATFAQTLANHLKLNWQIEGIFIVRVNHSSTKESFRNVIFQVRQKIKSDYKRAAQYLNRTDIDVVLVQHEYGIYGGPSGEYILEFLENLTKPVIISLHSVLDEHTPERLELTKKILQHASTIVVMTHNSKKILIETLNIDKKKIEVVPHGVPKIRFGSKEKFKRLNGLQKKTVLSTFGLIGPGKGIEFALEALRDLVKKHPEITYLIIGATHPRLLESQGETYRNKLKKYVKKNHLSNNVVFINTFLDQEDLVGLLTATDIYLAPQLDLKQAFSGTVAYSMGCGCAVISSPTNYALEVLADNRGFVASPNAKIIKECIEELVLKPKLLARTKRQAYLYASKNQWDKTAERYLKLVENANLKNIQELEIESSPPDLKYLFKLTDNFGIVQHAYGSRPNLKFGYSLDDQARALIVCIKYLQHFPENQRVARLVRIYLNFMLKAIDESGTVHNFFDRDKKYADEIGSLISHARSFWALSILVKAKNTTPSLKMLGYKIIDSFNVDHRSSIHVAAYLLLGYSELKNTKKTIELSNYLLRQLKEHSDEKWTWFDNKLTWGNAVIPLSLLRAYQITGGPKLWSAIKKTVEFLETHTEHEQGYPHPIGQDGWFIKGKKKATFDQQPIEASKMIMLYSELYQTTGDVCYLKKARFWLSWFHGNNISKKSIYNKLTGGVYDAVTRTGRNFNQGAESIVTYLLARLSFPVNFIKKELTYERQVFAERVDPKLKAGD